MISKGNHPIKSTLVFTVLGFLGPALSFFLLPIYLKYLTPEDYGLLSLMAIVSSFVGIVANLQLGAAFRTYYFDYTDQPLLLKQYLQNVFTLSIIMCLLVVLVLLLAGPALFSSLFKNERITFYPYGLLAIAKAVFGVCSGIYFIYLKNGIRLKEFALYSISGLVLTAGFQFYFIVIEQLGAQGALLGLCYGSGIIFLSVLVSNLNLLRWSFDKKMLRHSLAFAIPVIPFLFLNWFTLQGDRFLIERFLTLEKVGQYALLITLLGLMFMIMGALDNSIRPFLFEAFKEKEKRKEEINSYLFFYLLVCLAVASGIIFLGQHLHLLTDNPDYLYIVPFFVLGSLVVFIRAYVRLFNEQLYFIKRSKDVTYLSIISFVVLLVSYLTLLPIWGIWGALVAMLFTNIFNAYIFFYQAQKKFRLAHNYKQLIGIPLLVFTCIVIVQQGCRYMGWSDMTFGRIQFVLVLLLVYWFAVPLLQNFSYWSSQKK